MQSARPRRFQAPIRSRVAARRSSSSSTSSGSSAIQRSICAAVTSGWNWTPRTTLAEPVRLREAAAARELRRRRELPGVVVPLEGLEPARAATRAPGRRGPSSVSSTSCQPTSRAGARTTRPPTARAISCAPRQTPSSGRPRSSSAATKRELGQEPRMQLLLVGVHAAAEHDRRVVPVGGRRPARAARTTRAARARRARTASRRRPVPTDGPWVTASTRTMRH